MRSSSHLKHLKHVLLLSQEHNYNRAAERAHLSISAFSRSIQSLEESIGAKLFDRTPTGVRLTFVGTSVVKRAEIILNSVDDMMREVDTLLDANTGCVVLGVHPHLSSLVLDMVHSCDPNFFHNYRLDVKIADTDILMVWLREYKVDFFLTVGDVSQTVVDYFEIKRSIALKAAAYVREGHRLQSNTHLTMADMRGSRFAMANFSEKALHGLAALFEYETLADFPIALLCDDAGAAIRASIRSDMVFLGFESVAGKYVRDGNLRMLHITDPSIEIQFSPLEIEASLIQSRFRTLPPCSQRLLSLFLEKSEKGVF